MPVITFPTLCHRNLLVAIATPGLCYSATKPFILISSQYPIQTMLRMNLINIGQFALEMISFETVDGLKGNGPLVSIGLIRTVVQTKRP